MSRPSCQVLDAHRTTAQNPYCSQRKQAMPKVVCFTRILNEDDIIEAFVRHHATHVEEMLFLDNGSSDRTVEILTALRGEAVAG